MATQNPTTNYGWALPLPGADIGAWGEKLNAILGDDVSGLDAKMGAVSTVANAALPKAGGALTGPLGANAGITIGGAEVLSAAKVLAGVTADAAIITAGTFPLARIPAIPWGNLSGVPAYFPPTPHTHPWSDLTSAPVYTTRWPSWGEISSVPASFPPSAHTHAWGDIASGIPAYASRWPSWSEVTSKPATFAPSAHSHAWGDITSGIPAYATRWADWTEVTGKPASFPPSAHTHDDRYYTEGESDSRFAPVSLVGTLAIAATAVSAGFFHTFSVPVSGAAAGDTAVADIDLTGYSAVRCHAYAGGVEVTVINPSTSAFTVPAQTIKVRIVR